MQIVAYGEAALLVELPDLAAVHRLYRALRHDPPPRTLDLIPAARTLLVVVEHGAVDAVTAALQSRPADADDDHPVGEVIEIPVIYDGPDLARVARLAGLTATEVVERHCAPEYLVSFCGFTPGFGYLQGLDPRLHLPRLATPRVRVPSGAVAIAGPYSAIYPHPSPGGWHLLGRTDVVLFDIGREPPGLLQPAIRLRFLAQTP